MFLNLNKKLLFLLILSFSINAYSITFTILPFSSANEEWITEYKVDDGMPRVLEESIVNTKMFDVTDYDLLISYFISYDIVMSYKSLITNLQIASNFIKETFNSDYLITGEVLNFDLKKGGKYTANVEFKVDLMDINSLKIVKSFIEKGSYTLPSSSQIYSSEDALFNETALGQASITAFNKIANSISDYFNNPPLTGVITRIEDKKLYINLGKKNNIKNGDEFNIYKVDKVLEMPTNEISISTNMSNISKAYFETNNTKAYVGIRSNEKGDVWYTSEMLYKYRYYKNIESFVASAKVIELYENYAVLENNSGQNIEVMMKVKIKE